ncbi:MULTISPECIES: VanZ family protein [Corynebacterium]|uniref:VanZ family protein n=1 Tax=Corynebacterium TaxID=1716 RepID=UPI00257FC06F|nr:MULTISPECIES: VanZ family protein [Corynebacterium]
MQIHPRNRLAADRPARSKRRPHSVGWRLGVVAIVVLAVIAVVTLARTLLHIPGIVDASAHATRDLNLWPLGGFRRSSLWYAPWLNTIGNLLLFLPFGATALAVGKTLGKAARPSIRRLAFGVRGAVFLGFLLSLAIEVSQYVFAIGYSDIDDVIFNTLGTAVGAGIYAHLDKGGRLTALRAITAVGCGLLLAVVGANLAGIIG